VEFSFAILPPIWARWWFIAIVIAAIGGSTYAMIRYRVNRLLELERTRSRIAMDLHDDIGSSLTRISVMAEVAQRQEDADQTRGYLSRVGETARDLIESLSDIVWAVDPKHDHLQNVVRRLAQFGQEMCDGQGIEFETELVGSFESTKLAPDQRRDIYLVFKEGINNMVKHAGATRARFSVRPSRDGVIMELQDNGSGIPPDAEGTGHGLSSMRERGSRAGMRFSIGTDGGRGTHISLEIKTG
jgi:signal transduction histidine kinase